MCNGNSQIFGAIGGRKQYYMMALNNSDMLNVRHEYF